MSSSDNMSHDTPADRPPPRHARPPHSQNARRGANAWVGTEPAHPTAIGESPPCRAGVTLPGAAAARATRMDRERMAEHRAEPPGQILHPNELRPPSARG